jgi:uncharacterized membrane protein
MVWLRLLHIVAGSFWVGSVVFVAAFLLPTARAAGPDGGRFVASLMQRTGPVFLVAMLLTVIPGLIMFGQLSGGFNPAWAATPQGRALGAGALAALLAVVVGLGVSNPTRKKIVALRKGLETEGRTPTATEAAQLARWQARIERGAQITAGFLVVAAGAMAVARYL